MPVLSPAALARDLLTPDLTDPAHGAHGMQLLVDDAVAALTHEWCCPVRLVRAHPIVSIEDCYDRLGFPPAAVTRDRRYTRYVSDTCMLRSHTTAAIPPELRRLARTGYVADVLLACPGVVYRRDAIDRLHTGTPHQLDLWRITTSPCDDAALRRMIDVVVDAVLPGRAHRCVDVRHPYTEHGRQIDVLADDGSWVEVGECGIASPAVLAASGLDRARVQGLAMGLGLDRILMLRKGIRDIRLLRTDDPQMRDLDPYRAMSRYPAIERDVSVAVGEDETEETLGDQIRLGLGDDARQVESVTVVASAGPDEMPAVAAARLGIRPGQKNVLLRIVLHDLARTLTAEEANDLRDRIHAAVHRGEELGPIHSARESV